ncbi:MAG: glycosyltransferase family 4 protein [Nitrososphaerota archaeon]|nr:glycosyltransferase family 4 protein [Nitrososphaerota archaeon]
MKVAVIGWELPPAFSGGLGIHTFNLFGELSKMIDVDIYVPRLGPLYDYYPFKVKAMEIGVHAKYGAYGSISYDFYDAVERYNRAFDKIGSINGADVVHCHDWITFKAGIKIKERFRVPLIVTVHSTEMDRSGGFYPQKWIMDIEREGMKEADRVIAVSHYTKRMIIDTYGIPAEKIFVVNNGVGKDFLELPPRNYRSTGKVLYFGRITTQKGPEFFIEAAYKAISIYPKIKFVIAGTGDLLNKTKEEAESTLPNGSYKFTGFIDLNEALELYRSSDAFVLPAVSEPFGITVLESMSSGTPAIISKTTGVGESLRNVLKADFWDTDTIAEYIVGIVKYSGLRSTLGKEGELESRRFTWQRAADETLKVYRSA